MRNRTAEIHSALLSAEFDLVKFKQKWLKDADDILLSINSFLQCVRLFEDLTPIPEIFSLFWTESEIYGLTM